MYQVMDAVSIMSFADWLKQKRFQANLTQSEFARRIGKSRQYVNVLESGTNPTTGKPMIPSREAMQDIVEAFIESGLSVTLHEAFREAGLSVMEEPPEIDREAALLLDKMTEQWNRLRGKVPSAEQASANQASQRSEIEGNDALEVIDDESIGVIGPEGVVENAMNLTEALGANKLYRMKKTIPRIAQEGEFIALRVLEKYEPEDIVLYEMQDGELFIQQHKDAVALVGSEILGIFVVGLNITARPD